MSLSLDNDEVIVPVHHDNWSEMMQAVVIEDGQPRGGWKFDNFYFVSGLERAQHLPAYLSMINSYYRLPMKQGIMKYFANTSEAIIIEHHWPRVR